MITKTSLTNYLKKNLKLMLKRKNNKQKIIKISRITLKLKLKMLNVLMNKLKKKEKVKMKKLNSKKQHPIRVVGNN